MKKKWIGPSVIENVVIVPGVPSVFGHDSGTLEDADSGYKVLGCRRNGNYPDSTNPRAHQCDKEDADSSAGPSQRFSNHIVV